MIKKLVRPAGQLILAAAIGGAVPSIDAEALLSAVRPGAPTGSQPSSTDRADRIELQVLAGPQTLRGGYRLSVVEIPAPPADVIADSAGPRPWRRGCPVELRAVVAGADGGFAVVAVPGADDSILVGLGEEFATPRGRARVEAIQSRWLTLELGGATVECEVGASSRARRSSPMETKMERHEVPPL